MPSSLLVAPFLETITKSLDLPAFDMRINGIKRTQYIAIAGIPAARGICFCFSNSKKPRNRVSLTGQPRKKFQRLRNRFPPTNFFAHIPQGNKRNLSLSFTAPRFRFPLSRMPDVSNSNQFPPLAPYSVGAGEVFAEMGELLDEASVRRSSSPKFPFFSNGVYLYAAPRTRHAATRGC